MPFHGTSVFGKEDVIGQTIQLNEVEYRICGVVEDVSGTLEDTYAQVWIPYTSMSSLANESVSEREVTVGKLRANILLRNKKDFRQNHADEIAKPVDFLSFCSGVKSKFSI